MDRGQHVGKLVKIRQIVERRVTAHIVEIAQIGCAGHRDEDRMILAEWQVIGRVARVIGEGFGDRCDQLAHHVAV